jgi:hypothetical protein
MERPLSLIAMLSSLLQSVVIGISAEEVGARAVYGSIGAWIPIIIEFVSVHVDGVAIPFSYDGAKKKIRHVNQDDQDDERQDVH